MDHNLTGKKILIVQGSSLAGAELEAAFAHAGARVYLTANIISAFSLLERIRFDGAVVDQGLHNAAFELCSELQELGTPCICCATPHQLQKAAAKARDAAHGVWRIGDMIASKGAHGNTAEPGLAPRCEVRGSA
jgi:hypothetical protein